jgi:hypothetical protein
MFFLKIVVAMETLYDITTLSNQDATGIYAIPKAQIS